MRSQRKRKYLQGKISGQLSPVGNENQLSTAQGRQKSKSKRRGKKYRVMKVVQEHYFHLHSCRQGMGWGTYPMDKTKQCAYTRLQFLLQTQS